jgi:hypothetical protein
MLCLPNQKLDRQHQNLCGGFYFVRIAGDTDDPDGPIVEVQRDIDTGRGARRFLATVDHHGLIPTERFLRACMDRPDPRLVGRADDAPACVHHVDVVGKAGNYLVDDPLRQFGGDVAGGIIGRALH